MSQLLTAHSEKSGVCKAKHDGISKPALLCRDYRQCGLDILDTKKQQWYGKDDEDLLNIAYQEQRFMLTHDSDFGTLGTGTK